MNLMKNNTTAIVYVGLAVVVLATIASCSRKKDKWLNRNFHAMGTYYNILYNGNLALENGKRDVVNNYKEDYWSVLPIERMEIKEIQEQNPNEAENSNFERAEEKATKAIQKHSMFMGGKEYNPQIDEAFLLLGKSRYYDQRFIPSKDAFAFILNHYPKSSTINEAKIWMEKVNMRLEYYDTAIDNLNALLNGPPLEENETYEAASTLAQAYLFEDQKQNAIQPLDTAIKYAPNHDTEGRLHYIRGQLYALMDNKDSAEVSFDRVIELNRKSPRTYMIHAELEKLRLDGFENIPTDTTQIFFDEMAENRENRPYLDFIFYDNAIFKLQNDSVDHAIKYFNKSLREEPQDEYLRAQNHYNLGEIYFDRASYETAGKYYDSTITHLTAGTRERRDVKRKRDNLEDVIKFEKIADKNDSIINLINASEEERLKIFEDYVEELKIEEQSVFADDKAPSLNNPMFGRQQSQVGGSRQNAKDNFYFYDVTQKKRGETTFKKDWGDIELTDNWRTDSKSRSRNSDDDEEEEIPEEEKFQDPKFDPATYIAEIPTDEKVIDSISDERNFAYYQLGLIYKEKFREYELAIDKLENLLESDPEERLILPSKYYLFKIYEEIENENKANFWKNNILEEHPDSRYASILRNPEAYLKDENNPQNIYTQLYKKYKAGHYEEVIQKVDEYTNLFIGTAIVPKYELLKAKARAKAEGLEAYKESLNYVALTFPQSKEGKYAQELFDDLEKESKPPKFNFEEQPDDKFMLVYSFDTDAYSEEEIIAFTQKLNEGVAEEEGLELEISKDYYTNAKTLVTVRGLTSKLGAEGLAEKWINNEFLENEFNYFVISRNNYKIAQIHKNLDEYLNKLN